MNAEEKILTALGALAESDKRIAVVLESHTDQLEKLLNGQIVIESRLDAIDGRLDGTDGRFDGIDGRFNKVDADIRDLKVQVARILSILEGTGMLKEM